jgi:predicted small lipoprotein YifL
MRAVLLLMMLFTAVTGCGLKGPLYLPTLEEQQEMAQRKREREELRRRETMPPAPAEPAVPAPPADAPAPAQPPASQ